MKYIDYTYYNDEYVGFPVSESDFDRFAERASDMINFISFGRAEKVMTEKSIDSPKLKERYDAIKKATAAQTEVFATLGEESITGKPLKEISREQLGNAAVNYDVHLRQTTELYGISISGIAMGILNNAGLLYRGI